MHKKAIKLTISLGISAVLIGVVVKMADWSTVWTELQKARLWPIVAVTGIWFLHFWIRSFRWHFLLPSETKVPTRILFDATMLGSFATFILPLRAGEFVRPLFLTQHSKYSFSSSFVSIVIERFFDLCAVLLIFGTSTFFVPGLPDWTQKGAIALGTLAGGIFVFIVLSALLPNQIRMLITVMLGWAPTWISKFFFDLIDGAKVVKSPMNLLAVIFFTACLWASCVWTFYEFMDVLSIPKDFWLSTVTMALIALAVAAPSAPGFLGVYQVATIAAFSRYGISVETATAYSLLNHAHQFVIFILYGIYVLFRYGVSFSELKRASEDSD